MATINDVAKKAGVSATTVSVVLNKKDGLIKISPDTKTRVLDAAKSLDYTPNAFAKALRTNRSSTIAVLSFDIVDPYCSYIIRGAEGILAKNDYNTLIFDLNNEYERLRRFTRIVHQQNIDGVLIISASVEIDQDIISEFSGENIPFVSIGREINEEIIPSVVVDNFRGGYLAAEHLIKLAHREIAFILGPPKYVDSLQRWEGIKKALDDYAMKIDNELLTSETIIGWSPDAGYESMKHLLKMKKNISAVIAFDDISAFGAIRAILERGLRVPDNISVIGFDNLPASAFYNPPLTTIGYSMEEMGVKGAKILLNMIDRKKSAQKINKHTIKTTLVKRESTIHIDERR